MKKAEAIFLIGLVITFISGIIMSWFILSGNTYILIQVGGQYFPQWSKVFEYSVLGVFVGLIITTIGKLLGEEF